MNTAMIPLRGWLIPFLAVAFLFALWSRGHAHDNPDNWIGQEHRKNANGALCCGENDCLSYTVDQIKVTPAGYVFPDGELVTFNKVAPSIDHFYWICHWGGETKCVFAPLGAS